MYTQIDTSKLTRAGRFLLDDISLVSYQSADGSKHTKSISYQNIGLEMNLYESLDGTGLSGSVVVADGQSVSITPTSLTGYERIEFKLYTQIGRG